MQLRDILVAKSIDPSNVLVLRHTPKEPNLSRDLPWLAAEKPDVFNAHQQTQNKAVENAMKRASYVVSFIGHESRKAVFIGLYKVNGFRPLTYEEYWRVPAFIEMRAEYGVAGLTNDQASILWFDLELLEECSEWKGKLIVRWPPGRGRWWRWADQNLMPVHAILEDSLLDSAMPRWDEIVLSWTQLSLLPSRWRSALSQWRGIYYIHDSSDGKGYVGAAYGSDPMLGNILGRWENYRKTGHGGNVQLRTRSPHDFRFSILQRVSPDMEAEEMIRLESTWKDRLHTRQPFGLNDN